MNSRLGALAAACLLAVATLAPAPRAAAATPLDGFDPGNIISDASFFDPTTETAASLAAFLAAKGANCVPNPADGTPCLKDFATSTPAVAASAYCAEVAATSRSTAAEIISAVTTACAINPQVMVAILQKEQALVTASGTSLTPTRYQRATGAGCPDFATCDPGVAGFFWQVYSAARQFQRYRLDAASFNYRAGQQVRMQYHPETSCGTASFTLANQATAGLYNYTPFVPNAAAIANPTGTGDLCSAYGNRNLYRLLRLWFPTAVTNSTEPPIVPSPPSTVTPALTAVMAEYARVGGYATLGAERGPVACTGSYSAGPCTKPFVNGAITWSSDAGAATELSRNFAPTWVRWDGADRYAVAAQVAAKAFDPVAVRTVYVASGEIYSDALPGAAAAHRAGAPLLLVRQAAIPAETATALARFTSATRVVVLGGPGTVSDAVLADLRGLTSATVSRVWGPDRYTTAVAVAGAAWPGGSTTVHIAAGTAFADALSVSNLFANRPGPVLLAGGDGLGAETLAAIDRLGATQAYLVGGPASVPSAVEQQLTQRGISWKRLGGADRYAVNLAAAKQEYPTAGEAFLAAGSVFADGLAIGAPAALRQSPLLLTSTGCVPVGTALYLRSLAPTRVTIAGGTGSVPEEITRLRLC